METLKPIEVLHEACQHQCACGEGFHRVDTLRRHAISCRGKVLKKVDLVWRRQKECDKCLTLYAAVTKLFKDGRHRRHFGSKLGSKTRDERITKLVDRKLKQLVSCLGAQSRQNMLEDDKGNKMASGKPRKPTRKLSRTKKPEDTSGLPVGE